MRRFFIVLFVISTVATAGTLYWRTFLPESAAPAASEPGTRNLERSPYSDGSARSFPRQPSERQDLAVTISILSSIISAIAALVQTWMTARALKR